MFKAGLVKNTIVAAVFMAAMAVMALDTRAEQEALIPTQALNAFESWTDEFLAAPESEHLTLEARGIELAIARKAVLVPLIETDPEQALKRAISADKILMLPKPIRQHLEEHVSAEGMLQTWIATSLDPVKGSQSQRTVTIGNKTYQAFTYGLLNDPRLDNKRMPIQGILLEGKMAILEIPITDEQLQIMAADPVAVNSVYTETPKTVLYIPVYFTDQTNGPSLTDMDAVDAFLRANSYDKVGITTTFALAMQLSKPSSEYTNGTLPFLEVRDEARAIALTNGYDFNAFDWSVVRYNGGPGDFGGVAGVGGNDSMLKTSGYGTSAHELGHCLGLWHANYWETTDGTTIGSGRNVEYGNSFDVMGPASMVPQGHFNAAHKNKLNWIPSTNVTAVTNSGTYRIYAHDLSTFSSSNQYGITVVKDAKRTYWLEYRQHPGWSSQPWVMNGVTLLWAPWGENVSTTTNGSNRGSQLLDTTPGSADGKNDAPIVIGRTFSDADAGVHVTLIERGGTGSNLWADIVVNIGSFETNVVPTLSLTASATTPTTNEVVTFTATAGDANGDELSYHWDLGDGSFVSATSTVTRSWTNTGSRRVTCIVSDMKGGAASQYAYVNVVNAGTYAISGNIATSNGPLAGVVVSDGTRSAISDSLGHYVILNVPNGAYTLSPTLMGASFAPASRSVMVADSSLTNQDFSVTILVPPAEGPGTGITREWWLGIPGMPVGNLTGSAAYPDSPDGAATETNTFEAPLNWGTDYGQRMHGVFIAPATGNYRFYIASDDYSQLWLSTDLSTANIVKIASVDGWTNSREWYKYPSQKSAAVALVAGQRYYIMALHKESTGGDHLAVGVEYPGGAIEMPIPGNRLEPYHPLVLAAADAVAAETGQDPGIWTISRSGNTNQVVTVNFSLSGTATAGGDYSVSSTNSLTIPAGQTSVTITLTPDDDSVVNEGDETAVLTITSGAGYVISGSPSASILIADNDYMAPTVSAGVDQTNSIVEGTPIPWTPAQAAPAVWYDASDTGTIASVAEVVSQWSDKSGNHRHLTGVLGNPRTGIRNLNLRNTIDFGGTEKLYADIDHGLLGNPDIMIAEVIIYDNANAGNRSVALGGAARKTVQISGGDAYSWRFNDGNQTYGTTDPGNAIIQVATRPSGGNYLSSRMFIDGTEDPRTNGAGDTSKPNIGYGISIGAGSGSTNIATDLHSPMDGAVGEVIICSSSNAVVREQLEGYLAHKWGLVDNLSTGHPFKVTAPTALGAVAIANLDGMVTTGGGVLVPLVTWTVESSSPAGLEVTFADTSSEDTTATFYTPGIYTLRLTADDGVTQVSDTVVITIVESQGIPTYTLTVNSAHGSPNPSGVTTHIWNSVIAAYMPDGTLTYPYTTQYICRGWTGTGSIGNGSTTNISFTITNDTTLTWQWTTNYWLELNTVGE